MAFIIVTGMSGAGKSQAMQALEDIGYFCVDNVPPQLLGKLSQLNNSTAGYAQKMAVAIDPRSQEAFPDLALELDELDRLNRPYTIVFIDADDDVIFNRYKENRRKHPLLNGENGYLKEAIIQDRKLLSPIKERADLIIDTSLLEISQLKERITSHFTQELSDAMVVHVVSFGFKRGIPTDADLLFDVRCLPNPYYLEDLRPLTGLDPQVAGYVMSFPQSKEYLDRIQEMLEFLNPLYIKEGKSSLVVAIGCTGGKHRSVAFVRQISDHLKSLGIPIIEQHRDKDKHGY